MRSVVLDFETYSEVDARDVGAYAYARHPSTDIICMAYSIDGAEPKLWAPHLPFPGELTMISSGGGYIEAHNSGFEREIWREVGAKRYRFPPIYPWQWRCTMAACAYRGVALKLEKAAKMLRLAEQKDMPGNAAMRYLSKPAVVKCDYCKGTGRNHPAYPEPICPCCDEGKAPKRRVDFARLEHCMDYCAQDVRTEVGISRKVGQLPPEELRVWQLDQTINDRGVMIDQELCHAAIDIATRIEDRLVEEFQDLTGGLKPSQRDKVLAWLQERWTGFPDLTAQTIADMLDGCHLPGEVRRALEIRQQSARSSVKKYRTGLGCLCPDGRARGLLQYHGAGTGRWAGRLVQPQNLPRPAQEHFPMEDLCALIKTRDIPAIEAIYGDPMTALADAARGMIVPAPGHVLAAYDFSSIEAVVLAAMFGEDWKLELFRRKENAYCAFAEVIYGYPVNKKEHPVEYQAGKAGELAFGYQGGVAAWRKFDSSDRHTDEDVDHYKNLWRSKHPRVKAGWNGLDYAAKAAAMNPGEAHEYAGITYQVEGDWMSCRLLSGRKIWYLHPRITMVVMPWTDDEGDTVFRPAVEFDAYKEGQIKTVRGYGGHWTENVDQAISRDIMVGALFRIEAAGFPTVLTVHDEIVCEIPEEKADDARRLIPQLMAEPLPWSEGWPIRAEGGLLTRYCK